MILSALPERFADKIEVSGGCWEWVAAKNSAGYGVIRIDYRLYLAHRYIYEFFNGPVKGECDHLCRNRGCVNPEHIEDVTRRTNMLRGEHPDAVRHRTDTCVRGHDLRDAYVRKEGKRMCRECAKIRKRGYARRDRGD